MISTEATLLRVGEVAEKLACSIGLVYHLVASGEIPCVRLGRAIRIDPADLAEYLAAHYGDEREL